MSEMRHALSSVLKNAGVSEQAEKAFVEWPELEAISLRFLQYVSPWLVVNDYNLAEETLKNAFLAINSKKEFKDFPHRSFMEAIIQCVDTLASVRISVMSPSSGLWEIWSYDEPLLSWMEKMGKSAMMIRRRETSVDHSPLLIKLLAYVSSTRDMAMAEISFATPEEIFFK